MADKEIEVVETKPFVRMCKKDLDAAGRIELQDYLSTRPTEGVVIPRSDGIRKMRWSRHSIGKRGGARIIYYYTDEFGRIYLLRYYAKSAKSDINAKELKTMKNIVKGIMADLEGDE